MLVHDKHLKKKVIFTLDRSNCQFRGTQAKPYLYIHIVVEKSLSDISSNRNLSYNSLFILSLETITKYYINNCLSEDSVQKITYEDLKGALRMVLPYILSCFESC